MAINERTGVARASVSKRTAPRRRQRRKAARPGEIIAAATEVFAEQGFQATKIEDVARRAGVSKGTVFVYYPTKEELFRAVIKSPLKERAGWYVSDVDLPLSEILPVLLEEGAKLAQTQEVALIKLVIAEARAFPDLARIWHDEFAGRVLGPLTIAIKRAQKRGEVRAGDPRLHAMSIVNTMAAALILEPVFRGLGAPTDLQQLALQHATTILHGLLVSSPKAKPSPKATKKRRRA